MEWELAYTETEYWPVSIRMVFLNNRLIVYVNGLKLLEYVIDLISLGILDANGFGRIGFAGETGNVGLSQSVSNWNLLSEGGTYVEVIPKVTLSLSAGVGGSVNGAGIYTLDSNVSIQAIPSSGYKFIEWEGNEVMDSKSAETSVLLTSNSVITAKFEYVGSWPDGSMRGFDPLFSNAVRTESTNWWYSPWFDIFGISLTWNGFITRYSVISIFILMIP